MLTKRLEEKWGVISIEDELKKRGIQFRGRTNIYAEAISRIFVKRVAHKDFRKILREMED